PISGRIATRCSGPAKRSSTGSCAPTGRRVEQSPMSLNIKNDETPRLVCELAAWTGESMTRAVIETVRERRLRRVQRAGLADRLLAIGRDCAGGSKSPARSSGYDDLLYDERGLPR